MTMSSDKTHTKKRIIFFLFTFQWMLSRLTLFFSLVCFNQRLSSSCVDFCADCNAPFVLCHCMFFTQKTKAYLFAAFMQFKKCHSSARNMRTEVWQSLSLRSEWSDKLLCAKMSLSSRRRMSQNVWGTETCVYYVITQRCGIGDTWQTTFLLSA